MACVYRSFRQISNDSFFLSFRRLSDRMSRQVMHIISDLSRFNARFASATHRLAHDCYMILVGHITDEDQLTEFQGVVKSCGETQGETHEAAASLGIMEREDVEYILEHIKLFHSPDDFIEARREHLVFEDNFNSSLVDLIGKEASFQKLRKICEYYEGKSKRNLNRVMSEHDAKAEESMKYFLKKGLSEDDARAAGFAISFYTGTKSEAVSRGASLVARRGNGVTIEPDVVSELTEASIILYYLVKALSQIPYYWGYVTRTCKLTEDELKLYTPGALITWIQFSSSKKGKKVAGGFDFSTRKTFFKIYSLTGRSIAQFSDFGEDEDEVLFLPHSTFFIFDHAVSHHGDQHTIYMRQVELGLAQWSVLWVDDHIFDETWGNKNHMEAAAAKQLNKNVHFIPKSTTDNALSFLRSTFGQRLKNNKNFRIVTDMTRTNEEPSHNAGARLIKNLRQLGFKNECLVFLWDVKNGEQIMQKELTRQEQRKTLVSNEDDDLRKFVNFEEIF